MIKLLHGRARVGAREHQDAKRQEDDLLLWRDYHSFLTAKTTLLEQRLAAVQHAFERSAADERAAAQAQGALDRIPASLRALFEAVLEERRTQIQQVLEAEARGSRGRQLDPDVVDRRALAELLAEAAGQVATDSTPVGYGFFPRGAPGDVRWYALDVAELLAAPTAASYSVGAEPDDLRRRIVMSIGAGVAGIGFLLIWFLLPHSGTPRDLAVRAPLVSDGSTAATPMPMDVWPIQRAVLTLDDGPARTISVAATTSATWPAATESQEAFWQRNAFAPLRLCLVPELVAHVTTIQLTGGAAGPIGSTRSAQIRRVPTTWCWRAVVRVGHAATRCCSSCPPYLPMGLGRRSRCRGRTRRR